MDIAGQSWTPRNEGLPKDDRARTIQVLLHTSDNTVYAGTVDFGVYKTTDGGENWREVVKDNEGLPSSSRSILSLVQNPTDNTLYAGTYGQGVYRLRSDAEAWQVVQGEAGAGNLPVQLEVQQITFANLDGRRILAGLKVGGMYQYPLHAKTRFWGRLPQALPIGPARDVAGLAIGGSNQDIVVIAAGTGLFRHMKDDEGKLSWQKITDGLPEAEAKAKILIQHPQKAQLLYTVIDIEEDAGIYRSEDTGATWSAVIGDSRPDIAKITTLAFGKTDKTIYLGTKTGQVYVTENGGENWQYPTQVSEHPILELAWSQRGRVETFLYGGERQMLYARSRDGIYVSYDEVQGWHLRLRGFFSAMLADPNRPWVVYVASPTTAVETPYTSDVIAINDIDLSPYVWLSEDSGETWEAVGPITGSITTLAFDPDPAGKNTLYAGTTDNGILRADLAVIPTLTKPYTRPYTLRAIISVILLILILISFIFIIITGLNLGHPHGISPKKWPKLAYLRARHRDEVSWVAASPTPLTDRECLILARMPTEAYFSLQTIQRTLEAVNIPIIPTRIENALNNLLVDYHLLGRKKGKYRLISPLLGQIAHARFWKNETSRQALIKTVQSESIFRNDTIHFLNLAEFVPSPVSIGFKATSTRPEYMLLGADQGIYVHLHPATDLNKEQMDTVKEDAQRVYDGQLAGKIAFLVVSAPPTAAEVYEQIADWRQEADFRLVLLFHQDFRHIDDKKEAQDQLNEALRRTLSNKSLFPL